MASERRKQLLARFRASAKERLTGLSRGVQGLAREGNQPALADEVMRAIHTVKGDAKLVGLAEVNRLAHRVEDLLHWARAKEFRLAGGELDLLLHGLDLLSTMVEEEAPVAPEKVESFYARVGAISDLAPASASASASDAIPELPPARVIDAGSTAGTAKPPSASVSTRPPTVEAPRVVISNGDASQPTGDGTEPAVDASLTPGARRETDAYVRVQTHHVRDLTVLAGDLLLRQSRMDKLIADLERLRRSWADAAADRERERDREGGRTTGAKPKALVREMAATLTLAREELFENHLQLRSLHEHVREMRMRDVGEIFYRYPRAARELARELGKQVRVELHGVEVSVDQQVLDGLEEPLLHLVRNAIDHGIESPEARRSVGKAEEGLLTLSARQAGGVVEIEVADDGAGLDPAHIRATAIERGVIEKNEEYDEAATLALLFRAGFSTRNEVTDVSGRGVGLDVVKRRVEDLGGLVSVRGRKGQGARFALSMPVSVALARALLFQAADGIYAIPSTSVVTALRFARSEIEPAADGYAFSFGGRRIPLRDLGSMLGMPRPLPAAGSAEITGLVVARGSEQVCLRADKLLGERQLVQEPLDPFVSGLKLVSGTSVIDSGRVVLVLNVPELMRSAMGHAAFVAPVSSSSAPGTLSEESGLSAKTPRLLIVDDSEVVRDMLVALALRLGWEVDEAVDGQDALERCTRAMPDVVLTDLDMPVVDGFTFIQRFRARHSASVPVVVLSTRGAEEDKKRAMVCGATAYLVKANFSEHEFERTLRLVLGRARS